MLVAAGLVGCAAPAPPLTSPDQVRIEKRDSQFDSTITLLGQQVRTTVPRGILSDHVTWRIRTFVGKATGTVRHQLYATVWHQDRNSRRFYTANFPGGQSVNTDRIAYDPTCGRSGCSHDETLGVMIPPEQWAAAVERGLSVRLTSQTGGHVVIEVPSAYAQAMQAQAVAAGGRP